MLKRMQVKSSAMAAVMLPQAVYTQQKARLAITNPNQPSNLNQTQNLVRLQLRWTKVKARRLSSSLVAAFVDVGPVQSVSVHRKNDVIG